MLVDANLRQPTLHQYFGLDNRVGLIDMLSEDLVPQVVSQDTAHWRLKVIISGPRVDNSEELVTSIRMLKVLSNLREQCDIAIFDCPPFVISDSFVLASRLESVLMVIKTAQTRQRDLEIAMEQLHRAKANVLGVVMNRYPMEKAQGLISRIPNGVKSQKDSTEKWLPENRVELPDAQAKSISREQQREINPEISS